MRNRTCRLSALLLSVALHVGIASAFGNGKGMTAGHIPPQLPAGTIVASLHAPDNERETARPEAAAHSSIPDATDPGPATGAVEAPDNPTRSRTVRQDTGDDTSLFRGLTKAGPHYFLISELTEMPVLLQDISLQKVEALPGMPRRPMRVHLLINEQGEIDEVVIEEELLSEQGQRFLRAAFATVRFSPGKVGDVPVKSELSIEVTLEQAMAPVVVAPVTVQ